MPAVEARLPRGATLFAPRKGARADGSVDLGRNIIFTPRKGVRADGSASLDRNLIFTPRKGARADGSAGLGPPLFFPSKKVRVLHGIRGFFFKPNNVESLAPCAGSDMLSSTPTTINEVLP